jgi:hypothetical protein
MASSGKRKTTFSKLARESRLRERRLEKQAKKAARRRAAETQGAQLAEPQVTQLSDLPAGEDR